MTTTSKIDTTAMRLHLLMRRICKSLVTTGTAEFSMMKPDSNEFWFEGKIIITKGVLSYEHLNTNCKDDIPRQMLVDVNNWYQNYVDTKRLKGAA